LLRAAVNGVPARLALDTGSEVHLLTNEFADALSVERVPGEEGTDHAGEQMASWTVAEVTLALSGAIVELEGVATIPAPPAFQRGGIDGIISPQLLKAGSWTVIDLIADELWLVTGAEPVRRLLAERRAGMTLLELSREPGYDSLVVSGHLPPNEPLPVMLNTGGRDTEFARWLVLDRSDARGAPTTRLGGGVSGADVMGARIGPRTLLIGSRPVSVSNLAVRDAMQPPYGLIGMDVLRGTVVACSADPAEPVLWLVP
jgi:hypothetical protein